MGILLYKPKEGDIWGIYGEGEILCSEGIYHTDGNRHFLYFLLPEQDAKGKDSNAKNKEGKASDCDVSYPCKARFSVDTESNLGKAIVKYFSEISPDKATGFKGTIKLQSSQSCERIAKGDLSKQAYDLNGGFLDLEAIEKVETQFDLTIPQRSGGGKGGNFKSPVETARERAAIVAEMLEEFDKPCGKAYLLMTAKRDELGLSPLDPLEFAKFLAGSR